ncbi:hypothetical protein GCM10022225_36710 [Plantactinospora mayteni]|uniref:Uncharacterized protein n=1 Tax=Plantactinospora mayteni TaxID=566021 RepID=A0ABQ4F456_9ACTN|nr:hypothetical protein Pma05_82320 [Plantactinospora mayteni]
MTPNRKFQDAITEAVASVTTSAPVESVDSPDAPTQVMAAVDGTDGGTVPLALLP